MPASSWSWPCSLCASLRKCGLPSRPHPRRGLSLLRRRSRRLCARLPLRPRLSSQLHRPRPWQKHRLPFRRPQNKRPVPKMCLHGRTPRQKKRLFPQRRCRYGSPCRSRSSCQNRSLWPKRRFIPRNRRLCLSLHLRLKKLHLFHRLPLQSPRPVQARRASWPPLPSGRRWLPPCRKKTSCCMPI